MKHLAIFSVIFIACQADRPRTTVRPTVTVTGLPSQPVPQDAAPALPPKSVGRAAAWGMPQFAEAQVSLWQVIGAEMARLLALGRGAQDPAAPPCEQGYDGMEAIHAELSKAHPLPALPPRDAYLADCALLSPTLQRCLDLSLVFDTTCDAAITQADAPTRARFARLFGATLLKSP